MGDDLGDSVSLDGHRMLCGTCSWTDKTLLQQADWYPKKTMSAEERLRFYAGQFPIAEVDATYYAPPSPEQARLWAVRTPDGFRFDVKAYSLLTGHPTRPASLWKDLREQLPEAVSSRRSLYAHHLGPEMLDEAWRRFADALQPLREAGRLGAILFQYPPWFTPRSDNRAEIEALRARLPADHVCVELRSPRWVASARDREKTFGLLTEQRLAYVCVDAPASSELPRLFEVTDPDLFVMRFHGRSDATWKGTSGSAADRFKYLYSDAELRELARPIAAVAERAGESHLLMNNCYADYGVRNAAQLRALLT